MGELELRARGAHRGIVTDRGRSRRKLALVVSDPGPGGPSGEPGLFGTLVLCVRMPPAPLSRASLPDQVFARLREAILSGVYSAGERLPPQRALAAELNVNMATVREALGRLQQLRLVQTRHGDGTRVLDWRRSGALEALVLGGAGEPSVVGDLFEARRLLLVEAARLAAARRTPEQARELRELAAALERARDDPHTALLADWEFMAALVEAAGNVVFQLILNSVRALYLPHADAFSGLVAEVERLVPLYGRVADAVAREQAERAAEAIAALADAQAAEMLA